MNKQEEKIGYYVCSLVDILGQKEKLIQLNDVNLKKNQQFSLDIFRETYGAVKQFRRYTHESTKFVNDIKQKKGLKSLMC